MAEKTQYNSRFSFEDPLSKLSLSRSSRYRIRKRKKFVELQDGELSDSPPMCGPESGGEMAMDIDCSDSTIFVDCSFEEKSAEDFVDEDATFPDYLYCDNNQSGDDDVANVPSSLEEAKQTLVKVTSDLDRSLYSGSELTVASSCLLLKKFRMQHRLTDTAFADLLRLITLHCPRPNECPKSPYLFDKIFGGHKLPLEFHNFCSNCLCPVTNETKCPNTCCEVSLAKLGSKSQFIEVPIEPQLTTILQRKLIYMLLCQDGYILLQYLVYAVRRKLLFVLS